MKIIKDFPNYAACKNGEIINITTGKTLKPVERNGYFEVGLYKNGVEKIKKVHRLIAKAFLTNPHNFPCVNHKDENKHNNCVDNLEWCSYKYNNNYGKNKPVNNLKKGAIVNSKAVKQINKDGKVMRIYISAREAARQTGLNQSNISKCCRGKYKSVGGYIWSYCSA
jgi:hypothetical protein